MQPWPAPHVPLVPGSGPALRLAHEPIGHPMTTGGPHAAALVLALPRPAAWTPLGHAAALVRADLAVRSWLDSGLEVRALLALMGEADDGAGEADPQLAADMTALGVVPPDLLVAVPDAAAVAAAAREHLAAVDLLAGADDDVAAVAEALPGVQRRLVLPVAGEDPIAGLDAPPMAVRLLLLAGGLLLAAGEADADALAAAVARLDRWTAAVSGNGGPSADALVTEVRAAVAADLDAVRALRAVDAWAEVALAVGQEGGPAEADLDEGAPGVVARTVDALLGVRL